MSAWFSISVERQQGLESFDWLIMMVELVSSIWVLCCKTIVVCVVIVIHGNKEREKIGRAHV